VFPNFDILVIHKVSAAITHHARDRVVSSSMLTCKFFSFCAHYMCTKYVLVTRVCCVLFKKRKSFSL